MTVISKMFETGVCIWGLIFLVIGLTISSRLNKVAVSILETIFTRLTILFIILWILNTIIALINNGIIIITSEINNEIAKTLISNVCLLFSLILMALMGVFEFVKLISKQRNKRNKLMNFFFFESIFGDQVKKMAVNIKKKEKKR